MAKFEILKDDISGETLPEGSRPFTFTIQGKGYEIDLTEAHIAEFKEAIKKFTDRAREIKTGRRGPRPSNWGYDTKTAREYLRNHGVKVSDRGALSKDLRDRYEELLKEEQGK